MKLKKNGWVYGLSTILLLAIIPALIILSTQTHIWAKILTGFFIMLCAYGSSILYYCIGALEQEEKHEET